MNTRPIDDLLQELGLTRPVCRQVLLVDDEFEVLTVLEALLEDEVEVHTALGGADAIAILEANQDIDLVITDQRMPGMTGVALLSTVAARWPYIYRIVLTAYSDVDPIVGAINRGSVDRFVLKPWDPEGLRQHVAHGLATRSERLAMRSIAQTLANRHRGMSKTLHSLKDAQERASAIERLAILGWMTTGLTEELDGLLSGLRTMLAQVNTTSADPDVTRTAQTARDAIARVRDLIEDMRRLSAASDRAITPQPTDPRKLVRDAVRLLLEEDAGHNNPIHVQIDPELGALSVDATNLRQALLGLLRNATRASQPDSPIEIRVRLDPSGQVAIEVADQGCGMSPEVLQRATSPFFSAFDPQGAGLGLSISRLIAEAHGGRLSLLDNPPSGVIAQIWLAPPTEHHP